MGNPWDEVVNTVRNAVGGGSSGSGIAGLNTVTAFPLMSYNLLSGNGLGGKQQDNANPYSLPSSSAERDKDFASGLSIGNQVFYSPEMTAAAGRLQDLSKGYNGQELGALKEQGNRELEGQRGGYLRQLQGKAAQGGIGGARAAAMQGAADKGFAANKADNERKIMASNAGLVREGNKDYTNFLMQQRFGQLGTGLGYAQLGAGERAGQNALAVANTKSDKFNILNPGSWGILG